MKQVAIIALVLLASVALASEPTAYRDGTGVDSPGYDSEQIIKWSQAPWIGGAAIASQYAPNYPFWAESADDFECTDWDPIIKVEWWGDYFNGDPEPPMWFIISFYSNNPGPPSMPDSLLYRIECFDYHEEWDDYYLQYKYWQELPYPFEQAPGHIYWLSIVPALNYPPQWGWCECRPQDYWMDCAVMDFALVGIPRWTPMFDPVALGRWAEMAFVLGGPGAVPVEETTWGSIKAMYH